MVDFNFQSFTSITRIWSMLYFGGYITGTMVEGYLEARVPNAEVSGELKKIWHRYFVECSADVHVQKTIHALLVGDLISLEANLQSIALQVFSIHDTAKKPELWYHAYILGVILPIENLGYRVESNPESGLGRSDLLLYPPPSKPGIIIEFNTNITESGLKDLANQAIDQIKQAKYPSKFGESVKKIFIYGVAVRGKSLGIQMEQLTM